MQQKTPEEFLQFLAEVLMYDEAPLAMQTPFPALVFDSTGKLMLAAAVEQEYGFSLSLDDLVSCQTPGDVYELINKRA